MIKGYSILFGPDTIEIYANIKINEELNTQDRKVNKLYIMPTANSYIDRTFNTFELWHARLINENYDKLQDMQSMRLVMSFLR